MLCSEAVDEIPRQQYTYKDNKFESEALIKLIKKTADRKEKERCELNQRLTKINVFPLCIFVVIVL